MSNYARCLHKEIEYIRHIHLKDGRNNNKMERLNGELRDREKVMCSLKRDDSPIISGMHITITSFVVTWGLMK